MPKYLHEHAGYNKLAGRHDDLKYVLLHYGKQLGKALKHVQHEFKLAQRYIAELENKLAKEGYLELDHGIVLSERVGSSRRQAR